MRTTSRPNAVEHAATTLSITLEIEPDTTPVAGTLAIDGSEERPFEGWMELTHAIATAHESAAA